MRVGFSLSPGGLLLPYHLGVLDSLQYNHFLDATTPIAGASAGAIATAAHACGLDSKVVLDATIDMSDRCKELGGARGRLLPMLRDKLDDFIGEEEFDVFLDREGEAAIAYQQLFPANKPILQTEFEDKHDLMSAVCHSSTFPFFSTNWPVAFDNSKGNSRIVVDGFFSVPRKRYGCPDFKTAGIEVDRTIMVSPFPKELVGLDTSDPDHCSITPEVKTPDLKGQSQQLFDLFRLATQPSSYEELTQLYESGWEDAERWCRAQTLEDPLAIRRAEAELKL